METLKIKAILSAVKNNSLSKAAEEFNYTPSALSHMADSLDAELGVNLLVRTAKGVVLSAEGELLYEKLVALEEAEKDLKQSAWLLSQKKKKNLVIGAYSSISETLLPSLVKEFKKQNPEVKVSIKIGDNIRDWIKEGKVDLIFTDGYGLEGYEWVTIMKDKYLAVAPESSFLGKKTVEREELYRLRYLDLGDEILEGYFEESKFNEVISVESSSFASVISMVKEELGFSVVPSLMVKTKIKGVRVLGLEPSVERTLGIAYKKGALKNTAVKKFIECIKENIKNK